MRGAPQSDRRAGRALLLMLPISPRRNLRPGSGVAAPEPPSHVPVAQQLACCLWVVSGSQREHQQPRGWGSGGDWSHPARGRTGPGPAGQGSPPRAPVGGTAAPGLRLCGEALRGGYNKYVCSREARLGAVRAGPVRKKRPLVPRTLGRLSVLTQLLPRGRKGQTPLGPRRKQLVPRAPVLAPGCNARPSTSPLGLGTGGKVPGKVCEAAPADAGGRDAGSLPAWPARAS